MIDASLPDPGATEPLSLVGSAEAFDALTSPFRRELLVHCYRMLGSTDDAEDAVQDALARAWRGRATFQRAISVRAWLYRIATNACLDAIERRKRTHGGDAHPSVGPIPDDVLGDASAEPEARYDAHESISLAFLTALQLLPPRQRAVLILRDVLAWRASEVAALLELTVPAVNSALHRARSRMANSEARSIVARAPAAEPHGLRALLERYVRAWESADVAGLVALLREEAIVAMPPGVIVRGRDAIGAFLAGSVFGGGIRVRLVPVAANRGPGFAVYSAGPGDNVLRMYAILLVDVDESLVSRITVFADQRLATAFGLAGELPD
jgi:RNA polymerase sigma-70 factor (ECF subfamily)